MLSLPVIITIFSSTRTSWAFKYVGSNTIISAEPYKSSIFTNAIILLFFVYFFFTDVITPAIFTVCPSWNCIFSVTSSAMFCSSIFLISADEIFVFSIICSLIFSSGCPDTYIPSISFSSDNISFSFNSCLSIKLYFISSKLVSSFKLPKSNIDTWPFIPFLLCDCIASIIPSNEAISVALVSGNSENVPAFIKLSIHFLFTDSPAILSQKSANPVNLPFSVLSFIMLSTGCKPTFFMLPSPKRIFPFSTVNLL